MAGAGVRLFLPGEVLTASLVNTFLQDQVVARFTNAAARDGAFGGEGEPTLEEGRVCYLDSTNELQFYNGTSWVSISAEAISGVITSKGDLVAGTAPNTVVRVGVGSDGSYLVADASTESGVAWAAFVLPDDSVTSAKIADNTIVNADVNASAAIADTKLATIATALKVSNSATTAASANTASAIVARDASGNFVAGKATLATADVTTVLETALIVSSGAGGTININFNTNPTVYFTSNSTANCTLNIRGTSSVALNSILATGQIATVTFLETCGAVPHYPTVYQIDGVSVTPKFMGGTAPSSGNANSVDAYTIAIIKTGNAAFTVFASQTRFA